MQAIDARDNALAGAWQAEANVVITAADRDRFESGLHVAPTWRRHNSAARAAASARRIELLGFDPLAEPDRLPRTWTDSPSPRNRLDRFLREVYTNFPSADELPELVLPTVRDPGGEPSPRVRAVLEHFAAVDAARDAEGAGGGVLAGEAAHGTTLHA